MVWAMRIAIALLLCATAASADPITAPPLDANETKRLEAGDILFRHMPPTGGTGVSSMAIGFVDAPSDEILPVINNCKLFWQFMPRVKKSWVKQEPSGEEVCHVELKMPFPLPDLWSDSIIQIREEPKGSFLRPWKMVRGTYHRADGSWTILPAGDGTKSLVVYFIDGDPKLPIPDVILRLVQVKSMPEVIMRLRERVAALRASAMAMPVKAPAR
jgi:hypothetical protein